MKRSSLVTYTLGHFLIDFACGYILYTMYAADEILPTAVGGLFILYNMLAFATQHIFGALADKFGSNGRIFAVGGCVLSIAGLMVGGHIPGLTVTFMGLGNALFHVGGGIDSITRSRGMTRAGIFVSSGSLGVALGCHFGAELKLSVWYIIIALIFVAAALWTFCTGERRYLPEKNDQVSASSLPISHRAVISAAIPAISVLLFAVFIRAYAGFVAPGAESDSSLAFLLPAAAAFAGKFAGGLFSDLFGARRVGSLALLATAPLFALGVDSTLCFLLAVFLFNIAMPITLVQTARLLPRHEGFAFGLTTVALFLGYLIYTLVPISETVAVVIAPAAALLAAVCVFLTATDIRVPANKQK